MNRIPKRSPHSRKRGAMIILVLLAIILLIVGALFSIDVAYMHMVRAELRTATDASARAGAEALSRTQDSEAAIDAALLVAQQNNVGGNGLNLRRTDVQVGHHEAAGGRLTFVEGGDNLNAVRVMGTRLDDSLDGGVPLFFGRIFGTTRFEPVQVASATKIDRDIALVLDRSGSMRDFNKFEDLKVAIDVFLFELEQTGQDELMSLTFYNTFPQKFVDLTSDSTQIADSMDRVNPSGRTGIGRALLMGSDSLINDPLQRPLAKKTIVLMTDGKQNEGIDPVDAADTAVTREHVVHTITFGADADITRMRNVAEKTGGIHFHADNEEELRAAFREIALAIPLVLIE